MKKNLAAIFLISVLSACYQNQDKECPDVMDPEFPQSNLDWFSHEIGDTLYFKDPTRGNLYYLICSSRNEDWDPEFTTDYNCVNDGWYDVSRVLTQVFTSNMPHVENQILKLKLVMRGSPSSILTLLFRNNSNLSSYYYEFRYRYEYDDIVRRTDYSSEVSFVNSLSINEVNYQDVYIISHYFPSGVNENLFFDTLYYNKDGFLKFISSKYGYRLERLP
ncbi:MAG: hypothetical protein JW801_06400 [Bacteroidales bacterium]|nr:hypothetical protein [Bacteroidales bacterium]